MQQDSGWRILVIGQTILCCNEILSFAELSIVSNREKQSRKTEADIKKVQKREGDGGKREYDAGAAAERRGKKKSIEGSRLPKLP